jgi:hypothetical protein
MGESRWHPALIALGTLVLAGIGMVCCYFVFRLVLG